MLAAGMLRLVDGMLRLVDGMLRLVSNASNNVGFSIDAAIFIFTI
jgi:hypothetical protein